MTDNYLPVIFFLILKESQQIITKKIRKKARLCPILTLTIMATISPKNAKKYLKQNQDEITELIDQAYYQGSDDKSDEFAKNTMTELFVDTIKAWIKTEEEAKDNKWTPQYEVGFTQATIKQLQNIAGTASMYYLVNDVDLEKATKYFQDHYGDTEPTDLLLEIKDILAV